MKKEIDSIVRYRIQEAFDSLEEAKILLKEGKIRGAMNRIYYSMFYATNALLALKELSTSRHSGVISIFHREFVKTGIFPKELAKFLDIAFDLRTKVDYRDFVVLEEEKIKDLLEQGELFVKKANELIKTNN